MASAFWAMIDAQLQQVLDEKPDTVDGVLKIFPQDPPRKNSGFFAGGGGDENPCDYLWSIGWETVWMEADYYWCMKHKVTGEVISYIEGDIVRGDAKGDE